MCIFKKKVSNICSSQNCIRFLKTELHRLAAPYEKQNAEIEDFARWNLPDDIASDWEMCEYHYKRLFDEGLIDEKVLTLFETISEMFVAAYRKSSLSEINDSLRRFDLPPTEIDQNEDIGTLYDEKIWTHEGLKNHPFWEDQRNRAKELIPILEDIERTYLLKEHFRIK